MGRFNRQEGGEPYPDRIIAAESAERRYGCAGHSDYSVLSTNSELLPLAYSGRAAGAGCSTGNLFESGALAGFLWWISGGIPSLSVQNRKKHLHRSEPYEPAYQESGFAAAEGKANLRALTAQLEPEQRELVLLRFAQQLKLREIAQITGLPLRTVQSRLRAALKTLKMQLEKEDWR